MIDRAKIYIKAGNGGDGAVHFRREKFIPKGGPDGGRGGKGGDVYIQTDSEIVTLAEFAYRQKFLAENGHRGEGGKRSGKAGEDEWVKVPVGTVVTFDDGRVIDFDRKGIEMLVAGGGRGGFGNDHFKNSTNQTPREFQEGEKGEGFWLELELKLLADVGIIGLPNVGKSTLLSVLSNARPKIADYEFTTLEPNLGVLKHKGKQMVLADIPGLIEGASMGKGLGDEFLRHIERTRVLVHVMAAEDEMDKMWNKYRIIRGELAGYGRGVEKKREVLVVNKTDLVERGKVEEVIKFFKRKKRKVWAISCGTMEGVEELKTELVKQMA